MSRGETFQQYIERRAPILTYTSLFAEKFSEAFKNLKELIPVSAEVGEVTIGLRRPYNAVSTLFDGEAYKVTYTSFMLSPHQRSFMGFTDPRYQIEFEDTSEKSFNPQYLRVRVMGNDEVEIKISNDGVNQYNLDSWRVDSPESFLDRLQDKELQESMKKFGFSLNINSSEERVEKRISVSPVEK